MVETQYDALWEDAWDQAASFGPGFQSRYRLLVKLMQSRHLTGRLLDVGAGQGALLTRLSGVFPEVELHAHETSSRALDALRERPEIAHVSSGDLASLPPEHYQTIVCSEVLEHLPDDERSLSALVDRLAPGGLLFLTVPLREELWTPLDDTVGHKRRYAAGQLDTMCQQRGLFIEESIAFGALFYNSYYRLLGSRSPKETAKKCRSLLARGAARVLTELFVLEARWSTPRGGRGVIVARKPLNR